LLKLNYAVSLYCFWFPIHFGIKRESGVNPELSRSCKLYNQCPFLVTGPIPRVGKTGRRGVSQKTCHRNL